MPAINVAAPRVRAAGVLFALGLAASVSAQTNGSLLRFEVRPQGAPASAWTSDLSVSSGTTVEFRAVVTYTGTAPAVGLANATFQPTVSNWNTATDTLLPFLNRASSPATGAVPAESGLYGRVLPFGSTGITSTNALRGHTNNVAGVTYLRIAQNNTTNWVGVGPTSGTASANNTIGFGGIVCTQKANPLVGVIDPAFLADTTDVEVIRFAMQIGGSDTRVMVLDAPQMGIRLALGVRQFSWFSSFSDFAGNATYGTVAVQTATIRVPTPGALALLGFGGVLAARRRR